METRNGFSFRTAIRAWGYVVALGCVSLSAHAQSDFGDKIWWKADANSWVPDYNKSAVFPSKATPTGGGALVVNGAGIVHGPAEWPKASARSGIPGVNKSAPIDVVARFKPASVAGAVGRLATKLGPISSAVALVTFAAEVGFILTDGPDGTTVIEKQTAPPAGYDGKNWRIQSGPATWYETRQLACEGYAHYASVNGYPYTPGTRVCHNAYSSAPPTGTQYMQTRLATGGGIQDHILSSQTDPTPFVPSNEAATSQQLADAIAAKSGWPTSSSVAPAIVEALKRGEQIETEPAVVSGPASSPVKTSTTTKPDGSVSTSTTTNNYNYNTNKVTVTTTTVTTTVNPSTGATETTTTTENETPPETPPEDEKGACDLYPNALGCAELDEPTEEIPRDEETISYEEENVFGSGSCPANLTATIATLGQSVTVWDWSKTCELAFPLRALVLGLASFAALLIVMPGGNKT